MWVALGMHLNTVKEPGIHVPVDEGNLLTTLSFRELPPYFLGGDLAPAAHPCSVSLPSSGKAGMLCGSPGRMILHRVVGLAQSAGIFPEREWGEQDLPP